MGIPSTPVPAPIGEAQLCACVHIAIRGIVRLFWGYCLALGLGTKNPVGTVWEVALDFCLLFRRG